MTYTQLKTKLTEIALAAGIKKALFWNELALNDAMLSSGLDEYPFILLVMPNHEIKQKEYNTPLSFYIGVDRENVKDKDLNIKADEILIHVNNFVDELNKSEYLALTNIKGDVNQGYSFFISIDKDVSFRYNANLKVWCDG